MPPSWRSAAASAAGRAAEDRPRRYVVAVDVVAADPVPDPTDPTTVALVQDVPWSRIAAVLADDTDGADADDDLGWYAVQEADQLG
ncbi:MAG: hypothetical protein R2731_11970 [Nocardioides sp.]